MKNLYHFLSLNISTQLIALFLLLIFYLPSQGDNPPEILVSEPASCFSDWGLQIYDGEHFAGNFKCFRTGRYRVGKDCPKHFNRQVSIKVRPGYGVKFFNKYDRLIKTCTKDMVYLPNGFSKFTVFQIRGNGPGRKRHQCHPEWGIKVFQSSYFKGSHRCFPTGNFLGGRDCPNYYGTNISIKIQPGYYVNLYDKQGRLIEKFYGDVRLYHKGFFRFEVKKDHFNYRHQ